MNLADDALLNQELSQRVGLRKAGNEKLLDGVAAAILPPDTIS